MVRLGDILLEADVLTKRQLSRALAMQEAGDNRKLGEILVELGYITLDDLTDIMMSNGSPHNNRLPVEQPIKKTRQTRRKRQEPVIEKQPIDVSQDVVMKTKFALDVKTMIGAATKIGNIYSQEYPSRPEGYNWPRSYEQYKDQVGQLQEDMDDVFDQIEELEETIKELEKEIKSLERRKRDK